MTLDQAWDFVKQAWPNEGVRLQRNKNVCEVVAKDGTVMGRAFNWRSALREAYKPKLEANQKAAVERYEAMQKDRELFVEFLWEYLRPKFEEWKAAKKAAKEIADGPRDQGGDAGRDQVHSEQLVPVDEATQRPGPADPPRLVLTGRE